jgi:hypothetical protein
MKKFESSKVLKFESLNSFVVKPARAVLKRSIGVSPVILLFFLFSISAQAAAIIPARDIPPDTGFIPVDTPVVDLAEINQSMLNLMKLDLPKLELPKTDDCQITALPKSEPIKIQLPKRDM